MVHDPLIDPDRLTEPMSEASARSWRRLNDTPPPPVLVRSERAEMLLKIPLRIDRDEDRLVIVVLDEGRSLAFDGRLVERVDYALLGHGNRLLRCVLDAGLLLPSFDREAVSNCPSKRFIDPSHIAMYVSGRVAQRLIENNSASALGSPTGLMLLGERHVRSN